jgi:hypothetical protein
MEYGSSLSILRWYAAPYKRKKHCLVCGDHIKEIDRELSMEENIFKD